MKTGQRAVVGAGALGPLLAALRRRWYVIAIVALPLLVGAVRYTEALPPRYESTAILSFAPREGVAADVVRLLMSRFSAYATAEPTVRGVGALVGETPATVRGDLEVSVPAETSNLIVRATSDEPERAAQIANAIAAGTLAFAEGDAQILGSSVSSALPAAEPVGPPRRLIEAAAALVALVLGVLAALLVERLRPTVRTEADLVVESGLPLVGRLPTSWRGRRRPVDALADPRVGSEIRILRANLAGAAGADKGRHRVLAVTSVRDRGAKTSVAALLATASALLDERVLLVDADLAQPAVAKHFDAPALGGLLDVLRGRATLAESVLEAPAGLDVLATLPKSEAGGLLTLGFGAVADEARRDYALVVVDSPPMSGGDGVLAVATHVDGVLVVVGAGTGVAALRESLAALRAIGAPVTGVVAHGLAGRGSGYLVDAAAPS